MDKKTQIFEQGANAVEKLFELESTYICPLCLGLFSKEDLSNKNLTVEHVPPKSIGGSALLLTCKSCNNVLGSNIDSHLDKKHKQSQFNGVILGDLVGNAGYADLEIQGNRMRVLVSSDGVINLVTDGDNTNPEHIENIKNIFKTYNDNYQKGTSSLQFQLTSTHKYNTLRQNIADLKSAYLAATALLGYVFVFLDVIQPYRKQIFIHDQKIIRSWNINVEDFSLNKGIVFSENSNIVIVIFNGKAIVFPLSKEAELFLDEKDSESGLNKFSIEGKTFKWPESFDAVLTYNKKVKLK